MGSQVLTLKTKKMSKEFDEFMGGIQKEDEMNKEDTEKAMDKIMMTKDLKIQSDEIIRLKAELEKEIRQAFIHGQVNQEMMEAGLEKDETEDYVNSRMRSLLNQNKEDE
jgi:uncharacterized protein (DUF2267 family)